MYLGDLNVSARSFKENIYFKKHKYNAVRTKHAGYSFASKAESTLFDYLKVLERCGEIKNIQCQDHVKLTKAEILLIPDFKFFDVKSEKTVWAEMKGFETPEWRIKRRLWKFYGPGELQVYKAPGGKILLTETIIPKLEDEC